MPYEDFKKAEKVYMDSSITKKEIAGLYKSCPNTVFNFCDMAEKAEKLKKTEKEVSTLKKILRRYLHEVDDMEETIDKQMGLIRSQSEVIDNLNTENEELCTQLRQYRALFADIEKNMTVSLYSILLGIEK